jgi:hypothetical protein
VVHLGKDSDVSKKRTHRLNPAQRQTRMVQVSVVPSVLKPAEVSLQIRAAALAAQLMAP